MALIIRLRQQGAKNRQTYRLVVTNKRNPRDGKYLEKLGWYNPFMEEEKKGQLSAERIAFWLNQGAEVSEKAEALIRRMAPEAMREFQEKKERKLFKKREAKKKRNTKKNAV